MLAFNARWKLVSHSSLGATNDMNANVSSLSARHVPSAWIFRVNGTTFSVGSWSGIFAVCMLDTVETIAMTFFEACTRDILTSAFIEIAEEKFKVTVVIGVEFCGKINTGAGFVMSDNGNIGIGHEISTDHMISASLGVTANTCAISTAAKVFDGIVNSPSERREMLGYVSYGAAV